MAPEQAIRSQRASDVDFWRSQSPVSDPGSAAAEIDDLGADLGRLRTIATGLVFHYRGGGDFAEHGVACERIAEIDTRYADAMFERLAALHSPLFGERSPAERIVGCCRDFTVLLVSLARQHGFAARSRVGFASYFERGLWIDHVVAEVYDDAAGRWRLVEPQVSDEFAAQAALDPLDLDASAFLVGGAAWQRARSGAVPAEHFLVSSELDLPMLRGWSYLRHNLVHDLAAVTKHEMLLWDDWGVLADPTLPGDAQSAQLDALAAVMSGQSPALAEVLAWAAEDGFAVPDTVTTYSPARRGEPHRVDVQRITDGNA